ncbi:MAG: dihydrolipoyl dehydrogenase [Micromonosporaceae bacterium]|nr:dihydrolipoyl dehydrogenase [Micromonosporaceae bacterium]
MVADSATLATGQTSDVVVLGGGSGGYATALRAAQLGMTVTLIEKDKVGGTCLHRGCVPTKALLHAAEIAENTRSAGEYGVLASFSGIDMAAVGTYRDGIVARAYRGLEGLIRSRGITMVHGAGRLVAPRTVEVAGQHHTGRHLVCATGSYSKTLPGLAVDGQLVITSEHALALDRVPASAVILGGGVIGCEFASVWRSFGAEVTIVEALPRLIAGEDEASSKALERAFRKRRITLKVGRPFEGVESTDRGVRVTIAGGETIEAEVLLVAVGRGPVTDQLGYAEQGIRLDRGFVVTDERLRTTAPGVAAVGDIVPGVQLAHRGFAQGIFLAEDFAGLRPEPIDDEAIPRVTYTMPEVASVGLNESKARERYGEAVRTVTYDLGGNPKSNILKTQGFVKVVSIVDGPVVGIHLVGDRVSELIGEAQLIYSWEAYPSDVARMIHAHPTQNEALGEAHLALTGKPLHVHG